MTRSFYADCDRARLTADGTIRSCQFSDRGIDLLGALSAGADDEDLAQLWRGAMWNKSAGHGIDVDGLGTTAAQPRSNR